MKLKLKDLVKIKGGKRLPKGSNLQTIPNKHPYIKVKDMKNKFISLDGLEYVPDEIFTKIKNYIVNENDIIISIVGTIGLVSIIDSKLNNASQTENCAKLSGLDYIDSEYLYYFLISEYGQSEINKATVGAVQPKLPLYGIENIEIDWKTREDREKIIYILRNIDNKIELNTQTNQTLEQIAQGIFKHWFIDFAPVHAKANALARGETTEQAELAAMACLSGKTVEKITALKTQDPTAYHQLQQTAAAFPSEFVETEMGKVPKGWEWLKIENIISRLKNKQKINKNDISDIGNIPVFEQGQNILMGYHSDNPAFIATSQDPIFIFGDHTCITHISTKPFSIYQNVIPIKGKDIPTLWVYLAVKDKQKFQEYRRHWMEFIIKEICLPNRELIEHFVELVTPLFEKKDAIYEQNKILRKVRDELLPRLLSREIEL